MKATVRSFGESAILIDWPAKINERMHQEILAVNTSIQDSFSEVLIETVVTYHAIAVYLKETASVSEYMLQFQDFLTIDQSKTISDARIVTIPVCYDHCFALDMALVAGQYKLTHDTVISLHSKPLYPVYFLGFLPGFPYLGGLDKKLQTPRRETPRLKIAAGSVGIGGSQTGIYPSDSPGGWNIIGKTPISLFDSKSTTPNLLRAGDSVKFEAISLSEFENSTRDINAGTFQLKITSI